MIKIYKTGMELYEENKAFLDTNKYLSCFFALDAPLLVKTDKINYALKVEDDGDVLLVLKVEPYDMLLFGTETLAEELLGFLMDNDYEIKELLGSETVCNKMAEIMRRNYGMEYYEALAMDFMEAKEKTEVSYEGTEIPTAADLDEMLECARQFVIDCNLNDEVNAQKLQESLGDYRIIREDGKIVSMAKITPATDEAKKIAWVYTRPEYRGKGFARKVVATTMNEILDMGKIATLNVDQKNPVSYHLYLSLGFKKVFAQGEYRRKSEMTE